MPTDHRVLPNPAPKPASSVQGAPRLVERSWDPSVSVPLLSQTAVLVFDETGLFGIGLLCKEPTQSPNRMVVYAKLCGHTDEAGVKKIDVVRMRQGHCVATALKVDPNAPWKDAEGDEGGLPTVPIDIIMFVATKTKIEWVKAWATSLRGRFNSLQFWLGILLGAHAKTKQPTLTTDLTFCGHDIPRVCADLNLTWEFIMSTINPWPAPKMRAVSTPTSPQQIATYKSTLVTTMVRKQRQKLEANHAALHGKQAATATAAAAAAAAARGGVGMQKAPPLLPRANAVQLLPRAQQGKVPLPAGIDYATMMAATSGMLPCSPALQNSPSLARGPSAQQMQAAHARHLTAASSVFARTGMAGMRAPLPLMQPIQASAVWMPPPPMGALQVPVQQTRREEPLVGEAAGMRPPAKKKAKTGRIPHAVSQLMPAFSQLPSSSPSTLFVPPPGVLAGVHRGFAQQLPSAVGGEEMGGFPFILPSPDSLGGNGGGMPTMAPMLPPSSMPPLSRILAQQPAAPMFTHLDHSASPAAVPAPVALPPASGRP